VDHQREPRDRKLFASSKQSAARMKRELITMALD
jgi:hypothetical protein